MIYILQIQLGTSFCLAKSWNEYSYHTLTCTIKAIRQIGCKQAPNEEKITKMSKLHNYVDATRNKNANIFLPWNCPTFDITSVGSGRRRIYWCSFTGITVSLKRFHTHCWISGCLRSDQRCIIPFELQSEMIWNAQSLMVGCSGIVTC